MALLSKEDVLLPLAQSVREGDGSLLSSGCFPSKNPADISYARDRLSTCIYSNSVSQKSLRR